MRRPGRSATYCRITRWSPRVDRDGTTGIFQAEAVRSEKLKVWHSIAAIPLEHAIRGQYGRTIEGKKVVGYRQEDRVSPESVHRNVSPRSGLKLQTGDGPDSVILRTGKRLAKRFNGSTHHL